jgi:hypothetical protein
MNRKLFGERPGIKNVALSILVLINILCCAQQSKAYSVLTHEAIIDAAWDKTIRPLLQKKYPAATEDQLKEAHAYAYGGAVAPDMGYYPFGSKLFTNLVHYVRTGDFVNALFDEAQDINEYAFALGVLSHYYSDKYGHPLGTNHCVPLMNPKIKAKFGAVVTYEEDPTSHSRMEFGFDILQTARGNYASDNYHAFIGFKVSRPVLERAFLKTYGLNLNDIFSDFSLSIETFRWINKSLYPVITRAAWATRKKAIVQSSPGITRRKFQYRMHTANYYHEFGKKHEKPGFFPGILAKVIVVLPKVGPLKPFKIKVPDAATEKIFIQSFDTVLAHFTATLKGMPVKNSCLVNVDYDTGGETSPGEYGLADQTYIDLVLKLKSDDFKYVRTNLKQDILKFYGPGNKKIAVMAESNKWEKVIIALDTLKILQPFN